MKRFIRRIATGARWSPKYGTHPGTGYLVFLIALGMLAGLSRGSVFGLILGGAVMAAVFGPIYLWGCWEIGGDDAWNEDNRDLRRTGWVTCE